jgi:hypothetical protein
MTASEQLIALHDIVVRKTTGGYEMIKNRFSETGYLNEMAFAALRKTYPSARIAVL